MREDIFFLPPYGMGANEKNAFLTEQLGDLTRLHAENCPPYAAILRAKGFDPHTLNAYTSIPPLPVRLFKEYELCSVPRSEIFKTMMSSGTTGQRVSKIFLDRETAANQSKVLMRILSSFISSARLPMIILDSSAVLKDRAMFSARGAGILGFSVFGRDRIYALDENMELDRHTLDAFLERHQGEDILLFGFTFMIWRHFVEKLREAKDFRPDISRGTLIHGGGWKKLFDLRISSLAFKNALNEVCGLSRVYDYYGMVEQTGTIYMECERGHLHTSVFSDVLIRDPFDFSLLPMGKKGLIEVVSVLPKSYPGHALLTEDEGTLLGEDDCPCGRLGKYFTIHGRVKNAEIRGCSDTYAV